MGATASLGACATVPKSCRALEPLRTAGAIRPDAGAEGAFRAASVAELQCAADQGKQAAQVALAKRFEFGIGTERDLPRAVSLYAQAARNALSTIAIYSPPVTVGGHGRVLLLNNPRAAPGSAEAQYRLGLLLIEGKGAQRNLKRGSALVAQAIRRGYDPAIEAPAAPR
jgi:TPR repeat protein